MGADRSRVSRERSGFPTAGRRAPEAEEGKGRSDLGEKADESAETSREQPLLLGGKGFTMLLLLDLPLVAGAAAYDVAR